MALQVYLHFQLLDLNGVLHLRDGSKQALIIKRENKGSEETEKTENNSKSKEKKRTVQAVTYPNGAYGNLKLPEAETLLFKNATVWTNETQGVLKNTDVLVKHGKISAIGQNLNSKKARVIDATSFLNCRNTSGATYQDNFINITF